jgi:hypothetical protein
MNDLITYQDELQREGHAVLEDLKLLEFLAQFSKPHIVGSLATGLMTWRDIDLELYTVPNEEQLWQASQYLFSQQYVKSVMQADYRKRMDSPFPKGLYIGAKYKKEEGRQWKIDLWLMSQRDTPDYHTWMLKRLPSLTTEKKLAILTLKNALSDHPLYRKTIFSIDIYKAVIEEGVTDMVGFTEYLKKSGRSL